jgi:hypothetical protein
MCLVLWRIVCIRSTVAWGSWGSSLELILRALRTCCVVIWKETLAAFWLFLTGNWAIYERRITMSHGKLALEYCKIEAKLQVCKSNAGYYIGTLDEDGCPLSRESVEYFESRVTAGVALASDIWTQRQTP